jgi:hypothetical protein
MLAWLDRAHRLIDPIKERMRQWLRMLAPQRAGRTLRIAPAHPPPRAGAAGGVTG